MSASSASPRSSRWRTVAPGLLVAATGVGAGDLALGALAGARVGLACLWAVAAGAFLKAVMSEGVARHQLVTGRSLLASVGREAPWLANGLWWPFLAFWTLMVGRALAASCGVSAEALLARADLSGMSAGWLAVAHAPLGAAFVGWGGYALFERVMRLAVGLMVVVVLWAAIASGADGGAFLAGLTGWGGSFGAALGPETRGDTLALLGGVGGTVTLLCYGHWIAQNERKGPESIPACRFDLLLGYGMTALFGVAMVVIGAALGAAEDAGRGANQLVALADRMESRLGPAPAIGFLVGAYGAILSSLLGVLEAVPALFAETWRRGREDARPVARQPAYRVGTGLLVVAGITLWPGWLEAVSFGAVQRAYGWSGAAFLPLLAAALLWWNRRGGAVGPRHGNGAAGVLALGVVLAFFGWQALVAVGL